MKKWSKIISLILVAVMIFSLVACNPNDNKSENDKGGDLLSLACAQFAI